MDPKTMRHAMKARLFAVALLATCAFAASANAQTSIAAKFNLPFEVHWGKNVLPAGEYPISMDSLRPAALVQSTNGKTAFYTSIPIRTYSHEGVTALFVVVRGNERIVRSVNLPRRGISLVYQPATRAEREMLAKADKVQAVPLITAGK